MKKTVNDILNKKELEKNLPVYAEYMSTLYYRFSLLRLSMNYYVFRELVAGMKNRSEIHDMAEKLNNIISKGILSQSNDYNILTDEIALIRKRIIKTLNVLTSYTDIISGYEYIINRIEYKFRDDDLPEQYNDKDYTAKVMRYILADDDAVVINSRISEIIRELPVRMTKSKFFEYLNEGLNVYKETDEKSFEDFLYMVGSSAMIYKAADSDTMFGDLSSIYDSLSNADYENIDEKRFGELRDMINYSARYIEDEVNIYMLMQQVVNDAYSILLTFPYVTEYGDEHSDCISVIRFVCDTFGQNADACNEAVEKSFINIEGKQESIHEEYMKYEHVLDETKSFINEKGLEQKLIDCYNMLYKVEVLVSDSLFVEFDGDTLNNKDMSREYFEKRKSEFVSKIEEFFHAHGRMENRAVMSAVLAALPVFFNNLQELQDYIYNSLESCRKKPEKLACIEVINSLIDEITD